MALAFSGPGTPLSQSALDKAAAIVDVDMPALWSVLTVESLGFGYLADRRPQILFERHIFHRRTDGKHSAAHPDISNSRRGGYGKRGAPQYDRLARAIALDREAALSSASWGLGQVMGFNAEVAGYADVEAMVRAMVASEEEQLLAMFRFIDHADLGKHLKQRDWRSFARGYNGPKFEENAYDVKLETNFQRFSAGDLPDLRERAAQVALTYLGFEPAGVDGRFGKKSKAALKRFCESFGLAESDALDEETYERLMAEAFPD